MSIPRINSMVTFDLNSCTPEIYRQYYEHKFPVGKLFVFIGEVAQSKGHCLLCDLDTGSIIGMYHTSNFREADEEEI